MSEIDWSKAPEGATHYGPETECFSEAWFKREGENWLSYFGGGSWFSMGKSLFESRLESMIPRPQSTQGLPEVGTVCEARAFGIAGYEWIEVKILLPHPEQENCFACFVVDYRKLGLDKNLCWMTEFRPLKSDRERQIEDALKVIDKADLATCEWHAHAERVIGSMVDAGYRRAP